MSLGEEGKGGLGDLDGDVWSFGRLVGADLLSHGGL